MECFRQYLKLSRNVRPVIPSSLPDKLFISFRRPHKPVTSTTLGRWLRTFMSAAGIDSQIYKARSVRSASTTAAANAFVPLSTIMSMADWSSASTFRAFYCKPLFKFRFCYWGLIIRKVDLHVTTSVILLLSFGLRMFALKGASLKLIFREHDLLRRARLAITGVNLSLSGFDRHSCNFPRGKF